MPLRPEFAADFAAFPAVLRALIEAELAAGNTIVEVGHSHPAPPAGAYFKLERRVTTRARASGDGLDFHERNSSLYSGVFTDERRFFFVLEPPTPPPPELDMDAIRRAHEPRPSPLVTLAERPAAHLGTQETSKRAPLDDAAPKRATPAHTEPAFAPAADVAQRSDTPNGCRFELHFRDARPPHEIRCALESELMCLFACHAASDAANDMLRFTARAHVIGAHYDFELRYVAALADEHAYELIADITWSHLPATSHEYARRTSDGWLRLWTRDLRAAPPPAPTEYSRELYHRAAEHALRAESHLDSVAAIQSAILDGLRRGGSYSDSHKEGGTHIWWRVDHFVRIDHGDDPATHVYRTDAEFLAMLRGFCAFKTSRHAGREPRSERDEWLLVLRLMRAS